VYAGRDPLTDNPIQVQTTFRGTETAARKALAKLVTEVEEGKFDKTKVTVGEMLDRWLAHVEAIGKARPKTVYEYRRKIDGRIRPALGDLRLTRLEPDTLDAWYQRWLSEGLSPSTVHIYHAILSAACRQAVKWGWLDRAPTDRATAPTPRSPSMKVPTPEQLSTIMDSADASDPVMAAAIALAALTGARRGELVALRWSDVDLELGTIRIERAVTVVDGVSIVGPTKTHQVRRVALDETGVQTLRRHWQFVTERSSLVESPLVDDPYILSYQAHCGTPVGPDTLTHRFKAICTKLEAPAKKKAEDEHRQLAAEERWDFHFHGLRHFSVTTLLAAGVDIRTVAERHGHAQATMTLNRYAHALPERDRMAAGILGSAVSRG
jgi:integrase